MDENKDSETPISINEAYNLLLSLKSRYKNTRSESYQIYSKTLEYLELFSRIKDKSAMQDLRTTLIDLGFTEQEIAIFASILPCTADDAKILVPSLVRLNDEIIEKAVSKVESILP